MEKTMRKLVAIVIATLLLFCGCTKAGVPNRAPTKNPWEQKGVPLWHVSGGICAWPCQIVICIHKYIHHRPQRFQLPREAPALSGKERYGMPQVSVNVFHCKRVAFISNISYMHAWIDYIYIPPQPSVQYMATFGALSTMVWMVCCFTQRHSSPYDLRG